MIERKILYYPTILAPTRWLKWATFYWDKVSSIIPEGWEHKPTLSRQKQQEHYKTMKYLWKEEDVFEPTRPRSLFNPMLASNLKREFTELVNTPNFQATINREWMRNPIGRIHTDKFSNGILDFLTDMKLAKMDKKDNEWYLVEESTSLLYMALLAKHLADVDPDYTVPSTDWEKYESMIYMSDKEDTGFPSFKTKFLDVLPIPRDDVPIRDILKFKKRRQDELYHFREVIDQFHKELSYAKSDAEIKRILVQYKEKILKGRSNLEKLMKDFNIKRAFATMKSLIGITSPAFIETIGFSLAGVEPIVSVPIIAGGAVVQVGYTWIDNKNKQRAKTRESPFSYLYYARQKGLM